MHDHIEIQMVLDSGIHNIVSEQIFHFLSLFNLQFPNDVGDCVECVKFSVNCQHRYRLFGGNGRCVYIAGAWNQRGNATVLFSSI